MDRERLLAAQATLREEADRAASALNEVDASLLRLALLDFAAEHGLVGYEFERGNEYDDEGGYYDTADLTCEPDLDDYDKLWDLAVEHPVSAFQVLFGDDNAGALTVAQLREGVA